MGLGASRSRTLHTDGHCSASLPALGCTTTGIFHRRKQAAEIDYECEHPSRHKGGGGSSNWLSACACNSNLLNKHRQFGAALQC